VIHILDLVVVVKDMMGFVPKLKYVDHDVTELEKFPDLVQEVYIENRGSTLKGILKMESKQWIMGLYNYGIMNLLEIPHFGRGRDVNACVKKL
jgi:hypothetical protein